MAQATKSKTQTKKKQTKTGQGARNGAKASTPTKRTASKQASPKKRTAASKGGGKSPGTKPKSTRKPTSRSNAASSNGSSSIPEMAVDRTKAAGNAVASAASKAKVPLIAGGTAIAGAAAGVVLKDRLGRSQGPLKRLSNVSIPKSAKRLDLDTVKSAADRVSAYGQQASDVAAALEKTRKKNK